MKKIAIFGGAFNPPTIAHQLLARYLIDNKYVDEVFLMPCYKHKFGKQMVAFTHRFIMCVRICEGGISATNFEKFHKTDGSYEMLKLLRKIHGKDKIFMIIGQDNADEIQKWKNWLRLINDFNFIVFPRKYKRENSKDFYWYTVDKRHIFLKNFKSNSISSTEVRKLLKTKRKKAMKYLDPAVFQYIKEHKLYR